MDILVIVGRPLTLNSSASLCNIAYINGLLENGYNVDLVTMSETNLKIDEGLKLPKVRNIFEYDCSKYMQLGAKKQNEKKAEVAASSDAENNVQAPKNSILSKLKSKAVSEIKYFIRNGIYGVYSVDIVWKINVIKKYINEQSHYDMVISISYPPISHKVTEVLINDGKVTCDKWIQIWEDPWLMDGAAEINSKSVKIKQEENRIIKKPDQVLYVSPLTMLYQKKLFGDPNNNMKWLPLPIYYNDENRKINFDKLSFGYFGDYNSAIRNLEPFYNVAVENNLETYICGSTDLSLPSTETVVVNPRLPLSELKVFEDKTNVLIFLCNNHGGQIPGKIYQYSGTNKIILFILDGKDEEIDVLKAYFERFERYIFCKNDEQSILEAIKSIKDYTEKESYTKQLDTFNAANITKCIVEDTDLEIY